MTIMVTPRAICYLQLRVQASSRLILCAFLLEAYLFRS